MGKEADIRAIIVEEIEKDLVGPRGGLDEILPSREEPTKSYLAGILFPKQTPIDREDDEHNDTSMGGEGDDSSNDTYNLNVGLKPASFGLTCTISGKIQDVLAQIDYGVYAITDEKTEKRTRKIFQRTHFSELHTIPLKETKSTSIPLESHAEFLLKYSIKKFYNDFILSIFVVNDAEQKNQSFAQTEMCIFQPKITLTATNKSDKIFIDNKTELNLPNQNDPDSMLFDLLFNSKKNFAIGHGCSVEWDEKDILDNTVSKIQTTFIPKYTIPKIKPRELELDGLYMEKLYQVKDFTEYKKLLEPIASEYEHWIKELESTIPSIQKSFQLTAKNQIEECNNALNRIRKGIEIVSTDKTAGEAFSFANRAMLLQQSYGDWAQKNRKNGKVQGYEPEKYFGKWRLFQLAFILLNIESITNPKSDDRNYADLLWFTTGGGKTEAYLGIITFTLAHRRLRNTSTDYRRYGTAVIMRYTLRLLTLQQFHRAASVMCACEFIRRKNPEKWGDEPFLVGLWVGSNTTPNSLQGINGAEDAIAKAKRGSIPREHNPIQIISCPWCGAKIDAYNYKIDGKIKQCRIYCSNQSCEFSGRSKEEDSNLPVVLVDEDVYKRCPSLIIGTVDKFAQMSWKWETGAIFGRVNKYCQKHGFVINELANDCGNHQNAESFLFEKFGPPQLEPPELIIQDELHLISGPLGTLTGLYETAIDLLCTNQDGIRPKIIASTATTRRAPEQILGLFNRDVSKIFPPQGFAFGQSFFAEEVSLDKDPGKTYLGVCSTAKSGLTILGRLSAAILRKARSLRENMDTNHYSYDELDTYYTLVSYFNSIRELGGANKMYDDSVPGFIQRIYSNFEVSPQEIDDEGNLKKVWKNDPLEKKELTSRVDSGEIPKILQDLDSKLTATVDPVDLLLCTNMLSVGVDISRLGVMIINGQPKNHSEYIQASGRIGRTSPGLIITSYNYLKPRDLSHYENFIYYHSTFHKNVEAVSLTPFASRARDKALFGVIVALVRLLENRLAKNPDAKKFDKNLVYVKDIIQKIRDNIALRVDSIDSSEKEGTLQDFDDLIKEWDAWATNKSKTIVYKKNPNEKARVQENIYYLLGSIESAPEGIIKVPNSLRDAEQSAKLWYLSDTTGES